MKNKDLKKSKESIIGKIIYGFLLFMPLLAIFVTCGYAIFNKNAYISYDETVQNEITITSGSTRIGTDYNVKYTTEQGTYNYSSIYEYDYISLNPIELGFPNNNYNKIRWYSNGTMGFALNDGAYDFVANLWGISVFNFTFTSSAQNNYINGGNTQLNEIVYKKGNLDNAFYYAVEKVEESNLFNWAENSLIYTGISNTCTQLSITNTFIPLLLAYWLIISVIYILYDIILMILIILHNKIHQIQDSI